MDQKQKIVVVAIAHNEAGQILITRRNDDYTPDAHDKWALVGGKVEYGEDPADALQREMKEETGVEIENLSLLPRAFAQFWNNKHGEQFQVVLLPYACKIKSGQQPVQGLDPKIAEIKFIAPDEAGRMDFLPLDVEMINLFSMTNMNGTVQAPQNYDRLSP